MTESQSQISPPVLDPPASASDPDLTSKKPLTSIGDRLSYFADYIETYPSRVPLGSIKSFGLLGVMVFGSVAGLLLLKQNNDNRNQASEGNKFVAVCKLREPAKLASKSVPNSTACLLNGVTFYECKAGYSLAHDECVINSPAK
jgi:hypothetical protein